MKKRIITFAAAVIALMPVATVSAAAPAYSAAALAHANAVFSRAKPGTCTGPQFQAMVQACLGAHCGGPPAGACINECIQQTLVACGA